eukprot:3701281-Rhodomonas_salina.1
MSSADLYAATRETLPAKCEGAATFEVGLSIFLCPSYAISGTDTSFYGPPTPCPVLTQHMVPAYAPRYVMSNTDMAYQPARHVRY